MKKYIMEIHNLTPITPITNRKRKLELGSSEKAGFFPIFNTPCSKEKSFENISPTSISPSRKKFHRTANQRADQTNKIVRYLQPKRLLPQPHEEVSATGAKENAMSLRVALVRIDDHNYCRVHLSPKKQCCNLVAENVTTTIDNILYKEQNNPCSRLGTSVPPCIRPEGCTHGKCAQMSSSLKDSLYETMVGIDLPITMIRSCWQILSCNTYPSPALSHIIFKVMKESADLNLITLAYNLLKRSLHLHPPCSEVMKNYYIHILNSSDSTVQIPDGLWSLRSLIFFDETLAEMEKHIENLLNPTQLKEKRKVPITRIIRKPKRFRESPMKSDHSRSPLRQGTEHSPYSGFNGLDEEELRKNQIMRDAIQEMTNEEKTAHVFCRFDVLVEILEWDLIVWLSRNQDLSKIRHRATCPLVVLALWKPGSDTSYDSVHCRRIFALYASAWVLDIHPRHLRTLARLIGLIAEVTSASEPNFGNEYPFIGEGCENLGRKLCDILKNPQLEKNKSKAVYMLRPAWLKMLVSANLLGLNPSLSSLDIKILIEPMSDATLRLRAHFLEAVMEFYHLKHIMSLLEKASKGAFKDVTDQQPAAFVPSYQTNYRAILEEISGYYRLKCQIKTYEIATIPKLLQLVLM